MSNPDELKQLIEDAAKLLGYKHVADNIYDAGDFVRVFDPYDPERGDLWKVALAARLDIEFNSGQAWAFIKSGQPDYFDFVWDDYKSLADAVLCAASAVYGARGV